MHRGPRPSPKALFRNHVVSEVRARVLAGRTLAQAVREVLLLPHVDHLGRPRTLFVRTVYRWMRDHAQGGYAALEDESRHKTADSTVLSDKFLNFLRREKSRDVEASLPEIIRRAQALGLIKPDDHVCRTSVWRAGRRLGIALTRRRRLADTDMRRYAYPNRMLMVLADGKHFRAGTARLKRVALVFLDDASRYGLDVVVGTSENTSLFLGGLYEVIRRFGLMLALFLDRGAGFKSDDTHATCARLGIAFIHGTAAYPEGHGLCAAAHSPCNVHLRNMCSSGSGLRWRGPSGVAVVHIIDSELVQEGEDLAAGSEAGRPRRGGLDTPKRRLLHGEVALQVPVRRGDILVPEKERDDRQVDAGLEQMHRRGVTTIPHAE